MLVGVARVIQRKSINRQSYSRSLLYFRLPATLLSKVDILLMFTHHNEI